MTLEFNHMYVSFELQNTDTSAITEAVAIFSIRIFRKCRGGGAEKCGLPQAPTWVVTALRRPHFFSVCKLLTNVTNLRYDF